MKICWDNLEKLRYDKKKDCWYKNYNKYIYIERCIYCKEPFFSILNHNNKFCSHNCSVLNWTNTELNILKENVGKISIYALCKKLPNRSRDAITFKTKKLGLATRFLQRDKSVIDYKFFEAMTPQLAHFLGFWYADGNIYKNIVSIDLNIKDFSFLKNLFNQFSNVEVRSYNSRPNECRGTFSDKKVANILRNTYGCIPNKSLTCSFPTNLSNDYLKYFLQGYFEGDGWISKRDKTVGFVTGSEKFYMDLKTKLDSLEFTTILKKTTDKYFSFELGVQDSYTFLKFIYEEPLQTITMKRKFKLYLGIKKYREEKENYFTLWSISKKVGIHNQTLYNWKEKINLEPSIVDKNGYCYYSKQAINNWFTELGQNIAI